MSNKAKRDAIKHAARRLMDEGFDNPSNAVIMAAAKIASTDARLHLRRAVRREERSRRSIARRATRKALAEALCNA